MKFAEGEKVEISDLASDTGLTSNGVALKSLKGPGVVLTSREHPPGIDNPGEASPSPHCLVQLKAGDGTDVEAWFAEARLSKAA